MRSCMGESSLRLDYVRFGTLIGLWCRYIKVANETMCRPIRALTEARGHATGKHVYVSFSLPETHLTDLVN
jgi:hypothetical protein